MIISVGFQVSVFVDSLLVARVGDRGQKGGQRWGLVGVPEPCAKAELMAKVGVQVDVAGAF